MRIRSKLIGGVACGMLAVTLAAPAFGQSSDPAQLPPADLSGRALTPAAAQKDEAEDGAEDSSRALIIVTGTLINRQNATSNAPITVIDQEELKWRGLTHLEEALNQLPQVTPTLGNLNSSDRAGPAGINLRRLGPGRTLTLINGQRVANDVNIIPGAMVERVDILTGGAGAVYGSDAIAGVVNYILKRDFTGITIEAEGSIYQHTNDAEDKREILEAAGYRLPKKNMLDGEQGFINIAAGTDFNDKRGNIGIFGGYRRTTPLSFGQFDNAGCMFITRPATPGPLDDNSTRTCIQRNFNPFGLFEFNRDGQLNRLSVARDGSPTFRPYDVNDIERPPRDAEEIYRFDESYKAGALGSYELTDDIQIFASLMYSKYDTKGDGAGVDQYGEFVQLNCDNPFLSASQATQICGPNAGVAGQSQGTLVQFRVPDSRKEFKFGNEYWRAAANIQGKLTDEISFNVGHSNASFDEIFEQRGEYDGATFRNALLVRNVNGTPTCLATIADPNVKCVPLNVFSLGAASAEATEALIANPGSTANNQRQIIYNATVSGTLGEIGIISPWAREAVGFAVTAEHRTLQFTTDSTGFNRNFTPDYNADVTIKEAAIEIDVPLIQDRPFVHDLTINGGYRIGDYSSYNQTVQTWKGEITYSPIPDLRFRASINRSVRVALQEAFTPSRLVPNALFDPCSPPAIGSQIQRLSFEQCAKTGVTRQQYDALSSIRCFDNAWCPANVRLGGNPDLAPERGTSYTAGVVIQPRALKGFLASIDFYDIKVDGFFRTIDPFLAFNQCLGGQQFFCEVYVRDPVSGRLDTPVSYGEGRFSNAGYQKNRGIDIDLRYRFNLGTAGEGRKVSGIEIGYLANFLLSVETQDFPGTVPYECKGYWGFLCGGANPVYKHNARVTWLTPFANAAITLNWRHQAATKISKLSDNPILSSRPTPFNTDTYPLDAKLPAADYFDLGFAVPISRQLSARLTINNIFDREPRIIDAEIGGVGINTLPGTYDPVGRTIRLGISARF